MFLSIVFAAYNEEKRIKRTLSEYCAYFSFAEIIVVCNGCKDNTVSVVEQLMKRFHNIKLLVFPEMLGKGGAIIEGLKVARGKIIGFSDADGAYPPSEFEKLLRKIKGGYPVVIASRRIKKGKGRKESGESLERSIASRLFNIFVNNLFYLQLTDTQAGAKVFKREVIKRVLPKLKCRGYEFDVELLWKIKVEGYRIKEVPINWTHVSGSRFNLFDVPKMTASLIKLRLGPKNLSQTDPESPNPFIKYIRQERYRKISEFIGRNDGKLLECGCGEGYVLERIKGRGEVYGMDISLEALKEAKRRKPNAELFLGDIINIPFDDKSFDITVACDVLEHTKQYEKAISEILRVTKPNGKIIIAIPNEVIFTLCRLLMLIRPIKYPEHVVSLNPEEIIKFMGIKPLRRYTTPFNLPFVLGLNQVLEFRNTRGE